MESKVKVTKAAKMLSQAKFVVVFTGAGISAESGIPTFRGEDGMWEKYRAEDLATPYAFKQDPKKVWEWYDWRRGLIEKGGFNYAHKTVAEMEGRFPEFWVITQNVDGLHRRAGSKNVIEIHGNLWRAKCQKEKRVFEFYDVPLKEVPPRCNCGSLIRPDVVWFGEALPISEIKKAYSLAEKCDAMLVVGTSALVQPAANIPYTAKTNSAKIIEVNPNQTPISQIADVSIFWKAGDILPKIWQKVKG